MATITRTVRRGNMKWTITRSGKGLPVWLGYVLIVLGLFFALALARYQIRLALLGTSAVGEVVAFDFNRRNRPTIPRVRFTTQDGRQAEFRGASFRGVPLSIGDRVPVLYIPGNPVFGEIATFRRFWLGLIVGSILSIAFLTGGVLIVRGKGRLPGLR